MKQKKKISSPELSVFNDQDFYKYEEEDRSSHFIHDEDCKDLSKWNIHEKYKNYVSELYRNARLQLEDYEYCIGEIIKLQKLDRNLSKEEACDLCWLWSKIEPQRLSLDIEKFASKKARDAWKEHRKREEVSGSKAQNEKILKQFKVKKLVSLNLYHDVFFSPGRYSKEKAKVVRKQCIIDNILNFIGPKNMPNFELNDDEISFQANVTKEGYEKLLKCKPVIMICLLEG